MICYTYTYFLCANDPIGRENEKDQSTSNDKSIGVMVIENNVLVKNKVNCIIYYIYILYQSGVIKGMGHI